MKPVADLWFGVAPCDGSVIHIRESHIDQWAAGDIWLISGSQRDLLFDTGTGIVPLDPLVRRLAGKPVIAMACCDYYDHAGGLHEFDERLFHLGDAESIAQPLRDIDTLSADELYALPYKGFNISNYQHKGTTPTRTINDGDIIDLGNRHLEVLHIPGRTAGSIALWEAEKGYLFGGETAFIDPFHRNFPPEYSVKLYEDSLQRLRDLPLRQVFGGHYGIFHAEEFAKMVDQEIGRYHNDKQDT